MIRRLIAFTFFLLLGSAVWAQSAPQGYDSGKIAFGRKDYPTALAEWKKSAAAGHVRSQYNIAIMYWPGYTTFRIPI